MFAIGGFCKAYKSIVSKRNSSQQDKNDPLDKSRKGSNQKGRNEESEESYNNHDDEESVSPSFFKRLENLPQSNNKDSPLIRSTSLGSTSSLSRNMSKNRRNPVTAAANHLYRMVSHKNMDSAPVTQATTAEAPTSNEFDVNNRDYSSNDEFGIGDHISLPRSLSQKAMSTSSSQRNLGRSLSRKYSQKGSAPDLQNTGEGGRQLGRSLSRKYSQKGSAPDLHNTGEGGRHLGRTLSRKYSQKGSAPDLLNTGEGGPTSPSPIPSPIRSPIRSPIQSPVPAPAMEKSTSRSINRQGTVPIMFSSSNGLLKPQAIERTLDCNLEELCFGSVKKISVARDVINDIGFLTQEEEQLTVRVQPGWGEGTKITFPGTGDGRLGTCPADIILRITEKKHAMYSRNGAEDLELTVELPLVDALTGCMISVPLLDGNKVNLELDDVVNPGLEKIIPGQGMPKQIDQYKSRGNLILKFLVGFPNELSDEQRLQVYTILTSTTT